MAEGLKINIKFVVHEPWELMYAIYAAGGQETFLKELREEKIDIDEDILRFAKLSKSRISKFLKSEIDYFFNYEDSCGGLGILLLAQAIISNPHIDRIPDFLQFLKDTDENTFMSYGVKSLVYYNSDKTIKDICDWESVKCSSADMLKLIESIDNKDILYKDMLIECLKDPFETKERFCLMLRQFYEKVYREIEEDIRKKLGYFRERYEDKFNSDEGKFIRSYLKTTIQSIKDYDVKVYVSYFYFSGESSWGNEGSKRVWYVLGAYSDKYFTVEYDKETVQLLFKALSDRKRLDMIELLAKRPWYVYELADELGLTPATVSYHLNMFWKFNIIRFERSDHRIYYSLDKEALKKIIDKFTKGLLHEE